MTVTDLILACNNMIGDPAIDQLDPALQEHMTKIRNAIDGIPLADRLRWSLEDETELPMAYRPVPGPPINPARLTCGPVH